LKKCRKLSTLRGSLNRLPKDLDETYSRFLQGIQEEDAAEVRRALQWLAFSARPLSLDELAEAVTVDPETRSINNRDRLRNPAEVLDLCSSLVVVGNLAVSKSTTSHGEGGDTELPSKQIVSFTHFSVKEYFTSERLRTEGGLFSSFIFTQSSAHAFIGQTCLPYLLLFDRCDSLYAHRLDDFPLLSYAATHWPKHVQVAERFVGDSNRTVSLALKLLDSKRYPFLNWIRIRDPERPHRSKPNLEKDFKVPIPPL